MMDTSNYEKHKAWLAKRTQEAFDKATKIPETEYTGWVCVPNSDDEGGYFESVAALRKQCQRDGVAVPQFVWACTPEPFTLNADQIVEQALEEHYEDAKDNIPKSELDALQEMLDAWATKQNVVSWYEDTSRAVILGGE